MNQKELKQEIKNKKLRKLYIFCSDDYFLKKTYRDKIVNSENFDLEIVNIEEESEINKISELASTDKLFGKAKRRVIYAKIHYALPFVGIDNTGNNIIILDPIECGNIKDGNLVKFVNPTKDEMKQFISYKIFREHKRIEKKAEDFILQKFIKKEASLLNIFLDKILLYCKDENVITYDDVVKLDDGFRDINVFNLTEYILQNDSKKFFEELDNILSILHPSALISILTNAIVKTISITHLKKEELIKLGITNAQFYKYKAYLNINNKERIMLLTDILYDMDVILKSLSDKGFTELFKARMFEWFNKK